MKLRPKILAEMCALLGVMLIYSSPNNSASEPNDFPVTGPPPPRELRSLDTSVKSLVRKWNVPGAAVAVVRDGKLIFERGYGYADLSHHEIIDPDKSLFRIASVSKPITAAAVLKLVQDGKLSLDDKVFDILNDYAVQSNTRVDKRIYSITVRDLLNMSAGWDKERSGDPILQPYITRAARRMKQPSPANFDTTARYVVGKKLDFTPGTKFAYSNFSYGLLGKLIEKTSGTDYQSYVREALFQPTGVQLYQAHTRQEDRLPNEVVYYAPLEGKERSFLPTRTKKVPAPYARAYMETDLPMIGWVATAPELATLLDKVLADDKLLSAETREQICQCPKLPCWQSTKKYFSMGWEVTAHGNGRYSLYKDGTLPGTRAFVEHTTDGVTWVALFNARPPQKQPDKFALQIKQLMANSVDYITAREPRRDRAADGLVQCGASDQASQAQTSMLQKLP